MRNDRVAVYYWRSKTLAGGTAKCWVDDNESGAEVVKSWWDRPYNMARYVNVIS